MENLVDEPRSKAPACSAPRGSVAGGPGDAMDVVARLLDTRTGTGKRPARGVGSRGRRGHRQAVPQPGQVQRVNNLLKGWTKNSQPLPAGLPTNCATSSNTQGCRRRPTGTGSTPRSRFNQKRGLYLGVIYGLPAA